MALLGEGAHQNEEAIMSDVRFIASRLAERMTELGYTDESLAEETGIGKTTIYYLKSGRKGKHVSTSAENLTILADTLAVAPEFFTDEDADPSPNQKKMSALVADIANIAEKLSPAKQRQLREIGKALVKLEKSADVEAIYGDLVELIGRLTKIDGGEKALSDLARHLKSLSSGPSSPPVKRRTKRGPRPRANGESTEETTQGEK